MRPTVLPLALAAILCSCPPQQPPSAPGPTAADNKPPIPCTPRAASKAGRLATQGLGYGMASTALDLALYAGCEAIARTAPQVKGK